jgi:hypothetical protein
MKWLLSIASARVANCIASSTAPRLRQSANTTSSAESSAGSRRRTSRYSAAASAVRPRAVRTSARARRSQLNCFSYGCPANDLALTCGRLSGRQVQCRLASHRRHVRSPNNVGLKVWRSPFGDGGRPFRDTIVTQFPKTSTELEIGKNRIALADQKEILRKVHTWAKRTELR